MNSHATRGPGAGVDPSSADRNDGRGTSRNDDESARKPPPSAEAGPPSAFPYEDLQPRLDTNVLSFLRKHPAYDGRSVRIGIMDTGIFPTAHGIAAMRDGATPKLVHLVDCTGSGDVETFSVQAEWVPEQRGGGDEGHWCVTSPLTNRKLLLHKDWTFCPFPPRARSKTRAAQSPVTQRLLACRILPLPEQQKQQQQQQQQQPPRRQRRRRRPTKRPQRQVPPLAPERCRSGWE
jgi:hypothetical protein